MKKWKEKLEKFRQNDKKAERRIWREEKKRE